MLGKQRYFGRGILIGASGDCVFLGYFLMGRSGASQNRFLSLEGDNVKISLLEPTTQDTTLILYPPLVHVGDRQIVISNGSQTEAIVQTLQEEGSFEGALRTQTFEPDAPHFTPRISALVCLDGADFSYQLSLIKALEPPACARFFYKYESVAGRGHFLHTYDHDNDPLPAFCGEPKPLTIPPSLTEWGESLWEALDSEYKVALCVQSVHLKSGQVKTLIFNRKTHA
ncbi:IMP cyclohydrolase [Helicobacter mehlei]|uniref:IMP cyclohydrolase n=1 Tax=Helicobacter mehlei TaxID=2316080 RepID=A0A553UNG2_9HELI|nr:IMP cyclohydrolase [Helicobacter mehlei]TSA81759.1 IMP cyclohydrolase [Helicobacter mehlei]